MNGGWRQIFFLPFFLRTIWWKFQFTSQATSWNDEVKRNERTLKMIVFSFFFRLLLTASDWKKKASQQNYFHFGTCQIFILFRSGPHLPPFSLQSSHTLLSPLRPHVVHTTTASWQLNDTPSAQFIYQSISANQKPWYTFID